MPELRRRAAASWSIAAGIEARTARGVAGFRGGGEQGRTVGVVAVVLGDQVHGERDRPDARVSGEGAQRLREQHLRVAAGPPDVQGIPGFEAWVEYRREPLFRVLADRRERHPDGGRHVGHVRPLEPRVVHSREPRKPGRVAGPG